MIDDWEKQNGAFSMTFESITGGWGEAGTISLSREEANRGQEVLRQIEFKRQAISAS
jgi:hypothetical protein